VLLSSAILVSKSNVSSADPTKLSLVSRGLLPVSKLRGCRIKSSRCTLRPEAHQAEGDRRYRRSHSRLALSQCARSSTPRIITLLETPSTISCIPTGSQDRFLRQRHLACLGTIANEQTRSGRYRSHNMDRIMLRRASQLRHTVRHTPPRLTSLPILCRWHNLSMV